MVGAALLTCLLSGPARAAAPLPPAQLAYVTGAGTAPDQVWVSAPGAEADQLGPGDEPLLSPSGTEVAVSLFGAGGGEQGPALALYDVTAGTAATYLTLSRFTVQPLAWSHDSRYLAFFARSTALRGAPARSALDVLDTTTGTIATVAHGEIAGASFSPDARDLLVFAKSPSESDFPVDLYTARAAGGGVRRLTSDRHSLDPVWGAHGIAYDRERLRHDYAPLYEIWLRPATGSAPPRQLTHLRVPKLLSGLVPLGFSADGGRLIAEYVGEDTSEAWTVEVASRRARRVLAAGRPVQGEGISSDGSTLLVEEGSFEEPPSHGRIVTVPFDGGPPTELVAHGAAGSWAG